MFKKFLTPNRSSLAYRHRLPASRTMSGSLDSNGLWVLPSLASCSKLDAPLASAPLFSAHLTDYASL